MSTQPELLALADKLRYASKRQLLAAALSEDEAQKIEEALRTLAQCTQDHDEAPDEVLAANGENPVAWIAFAGNGNIRFWTDDPDRAALEKSRGMDLRMFRLTELVALAAKSAAQCAPQPSGEQVAAIYICYDGHGQHYISRERPSRHVAVCYDEDFADGIIAMCNREAPPTVSSAAREALEAARQALSDTVDANNDRLKAGIFHRAIQKIDAALSLPAAGGEASKREAVHHINGPFASPIKAGTRDLGVCLDCGANDGDDHSDGCSASLRKDG